MKRVHTPLAILAAAVFSLAACGGDDGGDDPDTTDATDQTAESEDTTSDETSGGGESSGDIPDEVREVFPNMTEEQFDCVNEAGADLTAGDMSEAANVLEECGVDISDMQMPDMSMPDMSMPDISMPDISVTDDPADMIRQMFPDLTEEQASCLAEAGDDLDPSNPAASMDLFEDCGIELTDLMGN